MSRISARPKRKPKSVHRLTEHGQFNVTTCAEGHIHVDISEPSFDAQFAFEPEDAYEFAQSILRLYDYVVGV